MEVGRGALPVRPVFSLFLFLAVFVSLITVALSKDVEQLSPIDRMFSEYQKKFPDTPFLNVEELLPLLRDPRTVLVDVREPGEQRVSRVHRESGVVLSREEFEKSESRYKDSRLVIYCTIGYRSGLYTSKLRKQGFEAYNLKGGILAWAIAKQPVSDAKGLTKRIHIYGQKWNFLPSDYEAVW